MDQADGKGLRHICCALICIAAFIINQQSCRADNSTTSSVDQSSSREDFPRGLWTWDLFGSFMDRFAGTPRTGEQITGGFNCYILDKISMGAELSGVNLDQPHDSFGGNLALTVRGHFVEGDGWSLYGDTALGLLLLDYPSPPGGSQFNFTVGVGAGATVKLSPTIDFMTGARFYHISNAGLDGVHRNPSYNAVQAYAGLMFKI